MGQSPGLGLGELAASRTSSEMSSGTSEPTCSNLSSLLSGGYYPSSQQVPRMFSLMPPCPPHPFDMKHWQHQLLGISLLALLIPTSSYPGSRSLHLNCVQNIISEGPSLQPLPPGYQRGPLESRNLPCAPSALSTVSAPGLCPPDHTDLSKATSYDTPVLTVLSCRTALSRGVVL